MKHTTLGKHLLTILLSLVMACALCVPAMAEEETFTQMTAADFLRMANDGTITLDQNIIIDDQLSFAQDLTVDLAKKTLKLSHGDNEWTAKAEGKTEVVFKNGVIDVSGVNDSGQGIIVAGESTSPNIDRVMVTFDEVNFVGKNISSGAGTLHLYSDADMEIRNSDTCVENEQGESASVSYCNNGSESTFTLSNTKMTVVNGRSAIYYGNLNVINGSELNLKTRDNCINAYVNSMNMVVSNSTINATSTQGGRALTLIGTAEQRVSIKDHSVVMLNSQKGESGKTEGALMYKSGNQSEVFVDKTSELSLEGDKKLVVNGSLVEDLSLYTSHIKSAEGSTFFESVDGKVVLCNHSSTLVSGQKEATCTEKGYSGDTVCIVCGKTVTVGQEIDINPNNHDLKLVEAVAATTEAEGVLAHYECLACNKWYWDDAGKNPIASQNAVVTAKLTSQTEKLNSEVGKPEETFTVTAEGSAAPVEVKIDTDKLMENTADTMATVDTSVELKNKAVEELAKQNVTATAEEVTLILTPAVEVENVKVDEQKATITMGISLVCKVEAKVGGAVVPVAKETVPNDQIKQDTVITISVPESWNGKSIIVRHVTKSRGVKFYSAVAADGTATFTVPAEDGFSPFTLYVDDGATVTVKLDSETKTYNRTDVVNETALPAPSKFNYAFKGWKFEGIDGQYFNMTAELFEALLDKNAVVIGSSVFEGPMSEHPEIEEAKKNGTWGVDDNKPAATAKPAAAAAVTPVRSSIPKTSDDSNLMLWVCLMGIAALGLGGAVYMKKRNHQ